MRAAVRAGVFILVLAALPLCASIPRERDLSRHNAKTRSFVSRGGAEITYVAPPSFLGDFAPLRETTSRSDRTAAQPNADERGALTLYLWDGMEILATAYQKSAKPEASQKGERACTTYIGCRGC